MRLLTIAKLVPVSKVANVGPMAFTPPTETAVVLNIQ
jgi:hypothetical protein